MNKKNKNFIQLPLIQGLEHVCFHYKSQNIEPNNTEIIKDKTIPHSFIEIEGEGTRVGGIIDNIIFKAKNPDFNPYKKKGVDQKFKIKTKEGDYVVYWRFRIFLKNDYKKYKKDYDNGTLRVNYFTDDSDHGEFDHSVTPNFYDCGFNLEIGIFVNNKIFTLLKNLIINKKLKLVKEGIYHHETDFDHDEYIFTIDLDLSPISYIAPVYTGKNSKEIETNITRHVKEPVDNPIAITYGIKSSNLEIFPPTKF